MKVRVMFSLLGLCISGCAGWEAFQPPPPEFEVWSKIGRDGLDVQKAMLECGYPSPFENISWNKDRMVTEEERAFMYMCMRKNGFVFDKGRSDLCRQSPELKACKLGVTIPDRDINKRISGSFCQYRPGWVVCKP